ncbi:MAG: ATP-dependent sacrificial sulfur transferase LarE [Gemmatimonadota bacterium]|nr:ATP-dependent sacrificial sulfur transferase LarE [Gemmatimonadota bacterium]MDP6803130.1 ATP-dependent sacrificial sulfur transferase LarE [Gemmatimonadota bacterium]MDP7031909.1 ATP-dependent sacrificial sulfur transferase LarE [Gemmatimonadota bacterium]
MTACPAGLDAVRADLRARRRVVVAFSGGVDSTLVLRVAVEELGDGALAVTGKSASVAAWELDEAKALAHGIGARHRIVSTAEVDDPDYAANAGDRCYHCKSELFTRLHAVAREEGIPWVVDGTNADDCRGHRPGLVAAREKSVVSPLAAAGATKEDVRAWSREMGLPTAEKPAMACLASRFPEGIRVTLDALRQVEAAEGALRAMGFAGFRVRHHGDVARVEVASADLERFLDAEVRREATEGVRRAGYRFVALDLEGYRAGSLQEPKVAGRRASPPGGGVDGGETG